jgi:hypothetical protein
MGDLPAVGVREVPDSRGPPVHLPAASALLFTHWGCSDDRDPRRRPADDSVQEVDDMTNYFAEDELDLVVCPEGAAPAEVVDRFALVSTDGQIEHVKVMCVMRHWFLLPAASLPAVPGLDVRSGTGPLR